MSDIEPTALERSSLEAHVDLCALRYKNLNDRITTVEITLGSIRQEIKDGQLSLTKVLIGTAGTIVAGLLSTIIVIIINF